MSPEMKRELLLALDAMLSAKDDKYFEGEIFSAHSNTRSTWPTVYIGNYNDDENNELVAYMRGAGGPDSNSWDLRLCEPACPIHRDAISCLKTLIGASEIDWNYDGSTNRAGFYGELFFHAFRAAVREELSKLQVA